MTMSETATKSPPPPVVQDRRFLSRFGPIVVTIAVLLAAFTLVVFAGYTPIVPTDVVVVNLFLANFGIILILAILMVTEIWRLFAARRKQAAGSRLHLRIVALFSLIAAAPAILIAAVGSITLDRSLNPAFLQDVRGFVYKIGRAHV